MNPFTQSTVAQPSSEPSWNASSTRQLGSHLARRYRRRQLRGAQAAAGGPEPGSRNCSAGSTSPVAAPPCAGSINRPDAEESVGTEDNTDDATHHETNAGKLPKVGTEAVAQVAAHGMTPSCRPPRPISRLWVVLLSLCFSGAALAVDVNVATLDQLRSIKGIGPKTAELIIEERTRAGRYESIEDLSERVKGIGPKKAATMQAAGLRVGTAAGIGATTPSVGKGKPTGDSKREAKGKPRG